MGKRPDLDPAVMEALKRRVGRLHLRQRLGIESEHVAQIFGQGRTLFHPENFYSLHALLRMGLSVSGMLRRGRRNACAIQTVTHEVALPHLPEPFSGFRLLHLSDLHLDMDQDIVESLMVRVERATYELCVITGDLRAKTFGPCDEALRAMERLRKSIKAPVYAVLGNHDFIEMVPPLEAMGVKVLLNEHQRIERDGASIYLAGVDDPHYYKLDNLEKAAEGIPREAVSVLLAHSPEIYRHAAHCGFDLYLCGHTHAGQICLPGAIAITYNAHCPRRFGRGPWRHRKMQGYTSAGAGSCIVPARFNCPPEITVHRLVRALA